MTDFTQRVAAALELLPPEMQEAAVAFLVEQGEKHRALKAMISDGVDDVEAGRAEPWNYEKFLREARAAHAERHPDE
jgi:hypothetical protein